MLRTQPLLKQLRKACGQHGWLQTLVPEDIASEDAFSELEYKHYTFHDAAPKGLPLKLFECQPVVGKKVVTMEARV